MATVSNRQFREINIEPGAGVAVWSGKTGDPVGIVLKKLNNYQREILSKACDFILGKLKGRSFEEPVATLMETTGFCVTTSNHVGAYSAKLVNDHIVVLNSKTFSFTNDEFAVTILHELLHFCRSIRTTEIRVRSKKRDTTWPATAFSVFGPLWIIGCLQSTLN